jgi:glycosyltransferase involved in cell wall biosynthesis
MKNPDKKRIAYVALIMSFQSGVANKMKRLAASALEESIPIDYYWFTTSYQQEDKQLEPLKVESIAASNPFKVRKWQAEKVNELLKKYHRVVIRYPLYDPVLHLFLKDKKRIITEHHTKELDELKLTGDKRYFLEKTLGKLWMKRFGGIVGVTHEIIDYEISRSGSNSPTCFIPNSIPQINEAKENPLKSEKIKMIMVANFRPWHGLDVIIEGIKQQPDLVDKYEFHLVGDIPEDQKKELESFKQVKLYGHMKYEQIEQLYSHMSIGIGSFKMQKNNMQQATILKVREYFANGLKVVMGYHDPAFPQDFPFILQSDSFNIPQILDFALKTQAFSKNQIIKDSEPYISSKFVLKKLYDFCIKL